MDVKEEITKQKQNKKQPKKIKVIVHKFPAPAHTVLLNSSLVISPSFKNRPSTHYSYVAQDILFVE